MHLQSCCLANINLLLFCCSPGHGRRLCLSSQIFYWRWCRLTIIKFFLTFNRCIIFLTSNNIHSSKYVVNIIVVYVCVMFIFCVFQRPEYRSKRSAQTTLPMNSLSHRLLPEHMNCTFSSQIKDVSDHIVYLIYSLSQGQCLSALIQLFS